MFIRIYVDKTGSGKNDGCRLEGHSFFLKIRINRDQFLTSGGVSLSP